jgi:murein DD-endopeptidase MepM/ murein hydrolase activator NlpD
MNTNDSNHTPGRARDLGAFIQTLGMNMVMLGLLALLGYLAWQRFAPGASDTAALQTDPDTAAAPTLAVEMPEIPAELPVALQPLATPSTNSGVLRKANFKTVVPSRPRVEVITYTVQTGDTLFSIAYNYNLKPETVLWGNFEVLDDNPHLLKPDQVLNVLPVDGVYYQWKEGDSLAKVAAEFNTEPELIVNYSGNSIDLTKTNEPDAGLEAGRWVIVPGGSRPIKDWGPPAITRQNAAAARYYGEGSCGAIYDGAIGAGTFVWPTTDRTISGYTYDPGVHPAIDIGGQEGNPIYATDSGVVVYAGWSDFGYGYLIAIDHGNGWQSAYAHLSAVAVGCGQSVYQGGYIGALGNTGNSSGPHLHFELSINGVKVNPIGYIQ